ncbi:MAG: type VI secretion system protein TssA [Isosphaeraceae bacterium]
MASTAILDIDALLAPIAGDSPAGGSVPFAVREKLEKLRKEIDPADFDEDDPMRPESAQKADWSGIIELAERTLAETSKDLLVAARLTEALVKEHGFAGLRDGLRLMRRMVAECWDRLNPAIESEDDVEVRTGPFHWLDEPDRGARFPMTLRQVPMLRGGKGPFSWFEWKESQSGKSKISPADIESALQEMPREACEAQFEDLKESLEELDALTAALRERAEQYAPALSGLRQAIGECYSLARQILERKGPAPGQAGDSEGSDEAGDGEAEGGGGGGGGGGGSFVGRQVASRAQVYRQLAQAAALLQQIEPHSPIPYLIHRAVELGALPFPELMRALIRDADVLESMNRELGIKTPEPEEDD